MVLARVADWITSSSTTGAPSAQLVNDGREGIGGGAAAGVRGSVTESSSRTTSKMMAEVESEVEVEGPDEHDYEAKRPPYTHVMLAGGLGGTTGDMLMHSLDTIKTRQQGDPHMPPKYGSMGSTYYTIWRQEGLRRGLYGGVTPAFLGSFSGTLIFFGTYEWSKRKMIDFGVTPSLAYFTSGLIADLAAAPLYVPSEVLKTRLQLQGRYNNPFFKSGYNYRGMVHAARTIVRIEGWPALFHGYKATLWRDLPFSALQFAFYEQEQKLAKTYMESKNIGLPLEILTGATAGGMAGVMTCPLDVVKTRIQTQQDPQAFSSSSSSSTKPSPSSPHPATASPKHSTTPSRPPQATNSARRPISTSSPSTSLRQHSAATLDTSSVLRGLRIIYRTEGIGGCFRGVGPRAVWTSVQSSTMLVLYQTFLRWFEKWPLVGEAGI